MHECGAIGCSAKTAALKCGRCQGVFYCNADCQKTDWKRHKPFCKPFAHSAPSKASVAESGGNVAARTAAAAGQSTRSSRRPAPLVLVPHSTRYVDRDLFMYVAVVVGHATDSLQKMRRAVPSTLSAVKLFMSKGGRPDVRITAPDGQVSTAIRHVLAWLPDLQPLLEAFLDEKLQPPIDLQAAVDVQEGHRSTPLEVAIKGGHPAFVRTLIEHGADVTRPCGQDPNGQLVWPVQALSMVAALSSLQPRLLLEILNLLIAAGADVNMMDPQFVRHPDHTQVACQPLLVTTQAMLGRPWIDRDPKPMSALQGFVLRLIDAGADLNVRDATSQRPLDIAATLPSLSIFKALVAAGADPSPTPFIALMRTHGGLSVQTGAHYLQCAVGYDRADVVEAAAAAGVNVLKIRTLGADSIPLLGVAAERGGVACARCLLKHGADVNEAYVQSRNGPMQTPLDTATNSLIATLDAGARAKREATVRMLRAAGGKTYSELHANDD